MIYLSRNILLQIKSDVAVWKRLGCPQRKQRTWWQTVATPYMGLAWLWLQFVNTLIAVRWAKGVNWLFRMVQAMFLFQYPTRRLIVRSRKVSKSRVCIWNSPIALKFDRHLGSTPADAPVKFQSDWDNLNYWSRGFETSRDLTIRRLIRYWNIAQGHIQAIVLMRRGTWCTWLEWGVCIHGPVACETVAYGCGFVVFHKMSSFETGISINHFWQSLDAVIGFSVRIQLWDAVICTKQAASTVTKCSP